MAPTVKQQIVTAFEIATRYINDAEKALYDGNREMAESGMFHAREVLRKAATSIAQKIAN